MTKSQTTKSGSMGAEEPLRKPDPPFQTEEDIAWEPLEEDLWIPYRIRGSWRGGVLG